MMKRLTPLLFLIITACSSSPAPSSHYYLLSRDIGPYQRVDNSADGYFIKTVRLADHLYSKALSLHINHHGVKRANYHFWAQPLDEAIEQVLEYELNQRCACETRSQRRGETKTKDFIVLTIFIDQLSISEQGHVALAGIFELQGKNHGRQRFYLKQTIHSPGFEQAVAAHRRMLTELAKQIIHRTENIAD